MAGRTLEGTVAAVTGAGRGIGRSIARALARAGARVAVAARTEAEIETVARELEASGAEAAAIPCDVTSPDSVAAAVDAVRDLFGGIDILVNNAGFAESAPLLRLDPELWSHTLAVNLTGTYLWTRAVLPEMIERRGGRVINVASTAGRVGYRYSSAYCAAKHGVIGFTRALALELADKGITVNAVCPGWVDTDMTAASIARIVEKTGQSPQEARRTLEHMNPQRRLIRPEEVADVVVFLAAAGASGITGQAIAVDGGEVMG